MGLCKCPKKKVTNLFCFVHKINVCEHCMVEQHPKCVVQTYLKWLEDSDFDPLCVFCGQTLEEGDVIRLTCFDLCHVTCLNYYGLAKSSGAALSDYQCPKCQEGVIPPDRLVSPVAEALRHVLSQFTWSRRDGSDLLHSTATPTVDEVDTSEPPFGVPLTSTPFHQQGSVHLRPTTEVPPFSTTAGGRDFNDGPNSGYLHSDTNRYHPVVDQQDAVVDIISKDREEDKYRKKNPTTWLARWIRNQRSLSLGADEQSSIKKSVFLVIFVIIVICAAIILLTKVGRSFANKDPALNIENNPFIRNN